MAKKIKNPIQVTFKAIFDDGVGEYHIEDVSIHTGMICEHGDLGRSGMPLEKNQEILNIVKDFLEEGLKQKEAAEGIALEDSMLDNGDVHYIPSKEGGNGIIYIKEGTP